MERGKILLFMKGSSPSPSKMEKGIRGDEEERGSGGEL